MAEGNNNNFTNLGQLPFTSDKSEELFSQVLSQWENLNNDVSPLIEKLEELKTPERYSVNSQFEQLTFKELN